MNIYIINRTKIGDGFKFLLRREILLNVSTSETELV